VKRAAAALLVLLAGAAPTPADPTGPVTYRAPIDPLRVVRPFDAPASPYGPGHRGVDLAARAGEPVRTAAAGVVTFAGSVGGRGVVVVAHADGVRTEYEPVRPSVHRGARLAADAVLGRIAGTHGSCAPGRCLHWGARRGTEYFDPLLLLARLGRVRLLPWSGPA
jgi:murein DD-endopeptidase MepM/ murein hydrolase activator NlpD